MKCLLIRCNRLYWPALFLLFTCYTSNSFAQVCSPDNPATLPATGNNWSGWNGTTWPSAEASCSDCARIEANAGSCTEFAFHNYVQLTTNTYQCNVHRISNPVAVFPASNTVQGNGCPSGYSFDGQQCVNDCTVEECPQSGTFFGGGSVSGGASSGCDGSCSISSGGDCISTNDPLLGQVTSTYCTGWSYTGGTCTGNNFTGGDPIDPTGTDPASPNDCPPQTGFAEVNGKTMCLPSGSSYTGGTTTTTNPDGTSSNTTTNTTINNNGGSSSTTTTNYYDAGGNLTGTGTTTNTGSAISDGKEQNRVDLGEAPAFDETLPAEPNFNITTLSNPNLSTDIFSVAGSCPAPVTYQAMGQDFIIDIQPLCDLSDVIRGIVLLLSAIAAIRIIVSG